MNQLCGTRYGPPWLSLTGLGGRLVSQPQDGDRGARLDSLADPGLPLETLIVLRQIAEGVIGGMLTPEEAIRGASNLSSKFSDLFSFSDHKSFAQVAAVIGSVLLARSSQNTKPEK
jgi:hypothetical protein